MIPNPIPDPRRLLPHLHDFLGVCSLGVFLLGLYMLIDPRATLVWWSVVSR